MNDDYSISFERQTTKKGSKMPNVFRCRIWAILHSFAEEILNGKPKTKRNWVEMKEAAAKKKKKLGVHKKSVPNLETKYILD